MERHVDFASESDTSQNGSDGWDRGRILDTTACNIAGGSGGTAVAGHSEPTNNYEKSKHIEFKQSNLTGPIGIGLPTCSVLRRGNSLADIYRL